MKLYVLTTRRWPANQYSMRILVISSIMPAPLSTKLSENDVLFTTANYHRELNKSIDYAFLYVVPYSNFLLSLISNKWKEYRRLKKQRHFYYEGNRIDVLAVPGFRNDTFIKRVFIWFSTRVYNAQIDNIIKKREIDLIHAHNVTSDAALANHISKKYRIPYVVTTRDIHKVKITGFLKRNLNQAAALVSLNHDLKSRADTYNDLSFLIPHGVDGRFFSHKYLHSNTDPLRFVTVARLLDWKNIDKLLLALEDVDFDFQYDIYGEGPYRRRLTEILESLKIKSKVRFKGVAPYEEMPSVFSKYHLFLLISYPETFGRVFIEAMAVGMPVIAARGCGMDGFIEDGTHGFLVRHDDKAELTALLNNINKNRYLLTKASSHSKQITQSFSWEEIVKEIDNLYNHVRKQKELFQ